MEQKSKDTLTPSRNPTRNSIFFASLIVYV